MTPLESTGDRRTRADVVFDMLREQIVNLEILPGTRMSEVEIAKRFGLSRQPIRDAFSRLASMGLLQVRPQRSTIVRYFSMAEIQQARFIRAAVEVEVLRCACQDRDQSVDSALRENFARQQQAVADNDPDAFHRLDYDFHLLLCRAARTEAAFETISEKKAMVDRLCMLALTSQAAMASLVGDHEQILDGVLAGDSQKVDSAIRRHLDRLNQTVQQIHESHREYFGD